MKRLLPLLFCLLSCAASAAPVKLIFDTDMGNDVDDLIALCLIHSLQKRGACELLAVTISKDHPQAASFVDAVNTFYGYPDIPIGVVRHGVAKEPGKFNLLAEAKNADGSERYPHSLKSGAEAPDALDLIPRILAAQPDGSVVIAQVGFFTNLARLLDSPNTSELVAKKVKLLSLMAGAFQTVQFENRHLEYNVKVDVPSAQKLALEWPTPAVWCGYEIGLAAPFPHSAIERDLDYLPHHPLKEAYYLHSPPPHDRPTWDPATVLYAVFADRGYFDLSPPGKVEVGADGGTVFHPTKGGGGRHRYLLISSIQAARVQEAIVQLSVEPPSPAKAR